jgi:aminoglycoside 6-adenylyltransferase
MIIGRSNKMVTTTLTQLQDRIAAWAATRSEIRAILVVGSRAREFPPADEWADLDLHLFCTSFDHLLSDPGWLEGIGEVWTWLPELIDGEMPQLLVLFEGGEKVDFGFLPVQAIQEFVATQWLDEVHDRGCYPLVDKDGLAARLPSPSRRPPRRESPSEGDFQRVVNSFYYGVVYVAKQIRRRNLWVVKFRDWTIKELLLQMMEWHAGAVHGPEYDTFYDGHFLSSWTDAQTWDELHCAFGGFSTDESWCALFGTMDVFQRLAGNTALLLGYEFATTLDKRVRAYVRNLKSMADLMTNT